MLLSCFLSNISLTFRESGVKLKRMKKTHSRRKTNQRSAWRKGGFTLPEMIVTLLILGIFAQITIPNLTNYLHRSQFRRNEEIARTIYLDAETNLAHLCAAGQWENVETELLSAGELSPFPQAADDVICGIFLNGNDLSNEPALSLWKHLLDLDRYGGDVLNAFICVEIDLTTKHVHSVFYSKTTGDLTYAPGTDGYLGERGYDSRSERRLGCYTIEDVEKTVKD